MNIDFFELPIWNESLTTIVEKEINFPCTISCINAWSFYCYNKQKRYREAISNSYNLPDGISIVWGAYITNNYHLKRITGYDVLVFFLQQAETLNIHRILFLGAAENVLSKIRDKASKTYPDVQFGSISPSFNENFSKRELADIQESINVFNPQLIFVGLSAPKQEIFTNENLLHLKSVKYICNIGAAFEFYAGTEKRASAGLQKMGIEGLYRYLFHPIRHLKKDSKSIPYIIYKLIKNSLFKNKSDKGCSAFS